MLEFIQAHNKDEKPELLSMDKNVSYLMLFMYFILKGRSSLVAKFPGSAEFACASKVFGYLFRSLY